MKLSVSQGHLQRHISICSKRYSTRLPDGTAPIVMGSKKKKNASCADLDSSDFDLHLTLPEDCSARSPYLSPVGSASAYFLVPKLISSLDAHISSGVSSVTKNLPIPVADNELSNHQKEKSPTGMGVEKADEALLAYRPKPWTCLKPPSVLRVPPNRCRPRTSISRSLTN